MANSMLIMIFMIKNRDEIEIKTEMMKLIAFQCYRLLWQGSENTHCHLHCPKHYV